MVDNYIRSPIERFFNFNTCYMLKNKKNKFLYQSNKFEGSCSADLRHLRRLV